MAPLMERFIADIEGLSDLPSLSPVLAQLIATLGREDASVVDIAAIIRQDPVLVTRVLRSANSAAYAGRSPVTSIRDALLRLGLVRVRRLALVASLYDAVPVRGTRAARELFWQHSLAVAYGCEVLSRHADGSEDADPEAAFLSGLLHDIGLLVLESHYPKETAAVKRYADAEGVPLCSAEVAVLGVDHGELGALLSAHWSMADPITTAIRAHHRLELAPADQRWNACVVHLADFLASSEDLADLREGSAAAFDASAFEVLGLTPEAMPAVIDEIRTETRKTLSILPSAQ
jgi:HD-like signal output (HDOD) protein